MLSRLDLHHIGLKPLLPPFHSLLERQSHLQSKRKKRGHHHERKSKIPWKSRYTQNFKWSKNHLFASRKSRKDQKWRTRKGGNTKTPPQNLKRSNVGKKNEKPEKVRFCRFRSPVQSQNRGVPSRASLSAPQRPVSSHGTCYHKKKTSRAQPWYVKREWTPQEKGGSASRKTAAKKDARQAKGGSSEPKLPPWIPKVEAFFFLPTRSNKKPKSPKKKKTQIKRRRNWRWLGDREENKHKKDRRLL